MLTDRYEVPLELLENEETDRCSDDAFKLWIGLINTSLTFPERGVFRCPWKALSIPDLLHIHNAISGSAIAPKVSMRLFHELCELGLMQKRERDNSYYIEAAVSAVPRVKKPYNLYESYRV